MSIGRLGFIGRICADCILTVLWIISVMFMLMHKGKDFRKAFLPVPKITWGVAVGLAIIEVSVLFTSLPRSDVIRQGWPVIKYRGS